jgi:coenzyme PQQ synthesis protein D (PqqD)
MDPDFRPRPAEGIKISEVADGYVIYDPKQDRVHYLNQTAAIILELCNGKITAHELVSLIQDAYNLPEPPEAEVADCVQKLIEEGLIN